MAVKNIASKDAAPNHKALAPEYSEHPIDELTRKSGQLSAMLETAIGVGFDSFDLYSRTIKENYLWACADIASDIYRIGQELASPSEKAGA